MQRAQKITFLTGLFVAVIYLLYTLSFSSNWAIGQGLGDFYAQAQEANKAMFQLALWALICAFLSIVLNSHINKRLFFLNYMFAVLTSVFFIIAGIKTIGYVIPLKASYLEVNPARLRIVTAINYGTISTNVFDYGIVIAIAMFLSAIALLTICALKFRQKMLRAKAKQQLYREGAL
jgi:hypothetical protein